MCADRRAIWESPGQPQLRRYAGAAAITGEQRLPGGPRVYHYEVDVHGQLFLAGTKIRNFTSCYKDPAFLDFFYQRLRLNEGEDVVSRSSREAGFQFVSPCGPETNYVRADDTVLVFQKLVPEGLTYAGSLKTPFQPASLRVDPHSGYLYHPSPLPPKSRRRSNPTSRYGPYSLLRSSLVLEAFAKTLDISDAGGSFEWEGKRWDIGFLKEDQVFRTRTR